jgi:hypothetical protein
MEMIKRFRSGIAATGLAVGLCLAFGAFATGRIGAAAQDRREMIHHAEDKLKEARDMLANTPGEFGGHRDKAIRKIDEALAEVHEAWEHREP